MPPCGIIPPHSIAVPETQVGELGTGVALQGWLCSMQWQCCRSLSMGGCRTMKTHFQEPVLGVASKDRVHPFFTFSYRAKKTSHTATSHSSLQRPLCSMKGCSMHIFCSSTRELLWLSWLSTGPVLLSPVFGFWAPLLCPAVQKPQEEIGPHVPPQHRSRLNFLIRPSSVGHEVTSQQLPMFCAQDIPRACCFAGGGFAL